MANLNGLDYYSSVSTSKLREFANDGVDFICRYYCTNTSSSKLLTKTEAQQISDAGMNIVTIFQDSNNSPSFFTYDNGYDQCSQAISRAVNVGQPLNTTIYFAVDYDMRNYLSRVQEYFRGASESMRYYSQSNGGDSWDIGIYGGYDVIDYMYAKYGVYHLWQAKGWEYGQGVHQRANIHQYEVDVDYFGINVDKDNGYGTLSQIGSFRI